jgi:murein DD-endopeptidase MepM/ murein hydrolase activator NlpD
MSNRPAARPVAGTGVLAGTLLLLLLSLLVLSAAPSYAVPETLRETSVVAKREQAREVALEKQVDRREHALTAIFAVAERHARIEQVRSDRLRALGYTGDLPSLETILPVRGYHLSAGYGASGPHWASVHTGLDFAAPTGTDLVALADATVTEVAWAGAYGLRTILTLADGTDVWYCHQLASLVSPGQSVEIGELVGVLGSTGNTTGPHLHLEVRPAGGAPIDPGAWLVRAGMTP